MKSSIILLVLFPLVNLHSQIFSAGDILFESDDPFYQGSIYNVDCIIGLDDVRLIGHRDSLNAIHVVVSRKGYLGLGMLFPEARLHVDGSVQMDNLPFGGNPFSDDKLFIDANNNVYRGNDIPMIREEIEKSISRKLLEKDYEIEQLKNKVQFLESRMEKLIKSVDAINEIEIGKN